MDKSVEYYDRELRGIRTGRSTTALIDYIKVEYYGNPTDLRELAAISVPEPTRLVVKPFDPAAQSDIIKAIETADLGLNPQADAQSIRISVPAPSAERRKQLVNQVRKMAQSLGPGLGEDLAHRRIIDPGPCSPHREDERQAGPVGPELRQVVDLSVVMGGAQRGIGDEQGAVVVSHHGLGIRGMLHQPWPDPEATLQEDPEEGHGGP